VLTSTSTGVEETKKVVIDGVIFQFEQDGTKLVRIGGELRRGALTRRHDLWTVNPYSPVPCVWRPTIQTDEQRKLQAQNQVSITRLKLTAALPVPGLDLAGPRHHVDSTPRLVCFDFWKLTFAGLTLLTRSM
jgi:hypothetical protein